jgi:hypothetical protein
MKVMPIANECSSYLLAGNPEISQEVLEQLSRSPHTKIRRRVAENASNSLSIAIQLLRDEAIEVRIALTENQELLPYIGLDLTRDVSSDVRFALAENFNAPFSVLEALSRDENPYVSTRALQTLERASHYFAVVAA